MSHTEQMREALERIASLSASQFFTHADFAAECQSIAQAALTAPAAEVTEAMGEEQIVKCLVEASCIGVVKMSYDAGPYQITRPSINADKFARALIATRDAQWQSTRLRGGVPEGWSITRKDDGRIVVKAPNGDAWALENNRCTGVNHGLRSIEYMLAEKHPIDHGRFNSGSVNWGLVPEVTMRDIDVVEAMVEWWSGGDAGIIREIAEPLIKAANKKAWGNLFAATQAERDQGGR